MRHKYIDKSLLYNVPESITRKMVHQDFDKYHIHNIVCEGDEEARFYYIDYRTDLEDALYMDYMKRGVNYHAYIEEGMDARILMELRKCALIRLGPGLDQYYELYGDCETIEDIRRLRIECVSQWDDNYRDFDWQTYMLIRYCWGKDSPDILIDYESCFADGDYHLEGNPEIYRRQFLEQHFPKKYIVPREWRGVVEEPVDWDKYYEGLEVL